MLDVTFKNLFNPMSSEPIGFIFFKPTVGIRFTLLAEEYPFTYRIPCELPLFMEGKN